MNKPNYYSILSAEVRYDNRLRPNVKLLYAEITALCNMNGECFAKNKYFAELYNKSKGTISGWISELVKYGYISVDYTYKPESKEIEKRYIKILKGGILQNEHGVLEKNVKSNTTKHNNNITYINIDTRKLKFEEKVFQVSDISKDVLQDFVDYWTETNKSNTKMKFELQKTFDINLRLKRWCRNNKEWGSNKTNTWSKIDSQINEYIKGKEYL